MTKTIAREKAIERSLELYVDLAGDPAPEIYARFFARHPRAEELFADDEDGYLKSRMMDRVFMMLMEVASGSLTARNSAWWVIDHVMWDVTREMMTDMFGIIEDVIREGVGDGWTADMQSAWDGLYASMMPHVDREAEKSGRIMSAIPPIARVEKLREHQGNLPDRRPAL